MDTTTKHALPFPEGTDFLNVLPATFQSHAEAVDALLTPYTQGARTSRPVSTPGTPGIAGRTYRSTDDGGVDVDFGTGWACVKPGSGTALPSSPDDGMLFDRIVDSAGSYGGPVVWRCRYRAAGGTYKWEVSGPPLHTTEVGSIVTASVTPVAMTNGPTIMLPLAGDYLVSLSCTFGGGGASTTDAEAAVYRQATLTDVSVVVGLGENDNPRVGVPPYPVRGAAASDVLSVKVTSHAGISASFSKAALSAVPVRVG